MSAYKQYPKYKPSGVGWLGDVPDGWRTVPVFANFRRVKETNHPDLQLLSVYRDYGVIPKASRDDNFNKASDDLGAYQRIRQGDLVLNKMKAWQGSIGISSHEGIVSPAYFTYRPTNVSTVFDPDYLHHLVRSLEYIAFYLSRSKGIRVNQWDLDPDEFRTTPLICPPLPEQRQIAAFLDHECGKLDALQAKQERLIELLKEKRQALISHAVTRGLDPTAKLKPSGVKWLGEVPGHWMAGRVKTVSNFLTSGPRGWSERVGETGALFVQSGDLNDRLEIEFSSSRRVEVDGNAETSRTRLRDGDVVVCITGAKTGNVAVCDSVPEEAYINQHLCLIRPIRKVSPRFVATVLKSHLGRSYFDVSQYGLKQGLSLEDVLEAPIPLPPLAEQRAIVAHLDEKCGKLDLLKAKAERAIELLKERRSALISAAVTGKIDVRKN